MIDELEQELIDEKDALLVELQDIDRQLSERRPVGIVPDAEFREWRQWRGAALHARQRLLEQYRDAKDELRRYRLERTEIDREEAPPWEVVLKGLLTACAACGAYEDPEHRETMRQARVLLGQEGPRA